MGDEIQWRRRWSPTVDVQPWQHVKVANKTQRYLYKIKFAVALGRKGSEKSGYEILLTDLHHVWQEELDADNVTARSKKLNASVEAPARRLLDHISETMVDGCSCSVTEDDEHLTLTNDSQLAGMPFTWQFKCAKQQEQVDRQLTQPLVAMIGELMRRQQELITLLKNKDKEIDDYKSQGVKPTRRYLVTTKFDDTVFNNDMIYSKGFENVVRHPADNCFTSSTNQIYTDVMTKAAWINRSPDDILTTDGSSLDEDDPSLVSGATAGPSWENRVPASLGKGLSPATSPIRKQHTRTPDKSPSNKKARLNSPEASPAKDMELLRRQALEKKLAEDTAKLEQKAKKKEKSTDCDSA